MGFFPLLIFNIKSKSWNFHFLWYLLYILGMYYVASSLNLSSEFIFRSHCTCILYGVFCMRYLICCIAYEFYENIFVAAIDSVFFLASSPSFSYFVKSLQNPSWFVWTMEGSVISSCVLSIFHFAINLFIRIILYLSFLLFK